MPFRHHQRVDLRHDHVRALADAETDLPPILVHRPTMRVIDMPLVPMWLSAE